eukprot:m.118200 g.118200  ORF g.118200 m.118200 type:complete len:579 (+) comp10966_c0_seq4:64-1800(+)
MAAAAVTSTSTLPPSSPNLSPDDVAANRDAQADELEALAEIIGPRHLRLWQPQDDRAHAGARAIQGAGDVVGAGSGASVGADGNASNAAFTADPQGVMCIDVRTTTPLRVVLASAGPPHGGEVEGEGGGGGGGGAGAEGVPIDHLVPIEVAFTLGPLYPSHAPPTFTINCCWLGRARRTILCDKLEQIAHDALGDAILWQWYQFLHEDALDALGITPHPDTGHAVIVLGGTTAPGGVGGGERAGSGGGALYGAAPANRSGSAGSIDAVPGPAVEGPAEGGAAAGPWPPGADALPLERVQSGAAANAVAAALKRIRSYDQQERQRRFDESMHMCGICFEEGLPGPACMRLHCSHVWCRQCIGGYCTSQIESAQVNSIKCPQDGCDADILPTEIKQVVEVADYERYETMLLDVGLSAMTDVVRCPRLTCQSPVILENDSVMGECQACYFVFCVRCKKTWHGTNMCNIVDMEALLEEYDNASAEERREIEVKWGATFPKLRQMMIEAKDALYLRANSVECPVCGAYISKTDGCNKMDCSRCRCIFCYLCGKEIKLKDPYGHFSAECRLFEGMPGVEDDGEW